MKAVRLRPQFFRRPAAVTALALLVAVLCVSRGGRPALAWTASATLFSNSRSGGNGQATTFAGPQTMIQISVAGARSNATYAVFSCEPLTGGDFDCAGKNNPPDFQQVLVAPKALAPVTLTLVQQGTLVTDTFGNGNTSLFIYAALLPDVPHSLYNAVHLVNIADATDSYTGIALQTRTRAIAGFNAIAPFYVSTAIGVPVYVLVDFPGYAYPVAITALGGVPFVPFLTLPGGIFGGLPFAATVGLCPTGLAPVAFGTAGNIFFHC